MPGKEAFIEEYNRRTGFPPENLLLSTHRVCELKNGKNWQKFLKCLQVIIMCYWNKLFHQLFSFLQSWKILKRIETGFIVSQKGNSVVKIFLKINNILHNITTENTVWLLGIA